MRVELNIPLDIYEIASSLSTDMSSVALIHKKITAICTDTRECKPEDIFVAISGGNDSGEKYVSDALSKGCYVISSVKQKGVIHVDSTTDALLKIAELYKSKLPLKNTVAVTGSVGKSTTVKFISKILKQKYKVHSPSGNFNNHLGVPLTVLGAGSDTEILVLELGMNHRGEISRLSKYIKPDIGIITNIGTAHIGNLGSRKGIAEAKTEILSGIKDGHLLIPSDEPLLYGLKNSLTVGKNSSLSDFSLNGTDAGYIFKSKLKEIRDIHFFVSREHLLTNLSFAISVAVLLGLSENEIQNGIASISDEDLRQRFIVLHDFTIFDDSYNASLESVIADLIYISKHNGARSALLGDVLELGVDTARIHESIGRIAADLKIDRLYLYGSYAVHIAEGATNAGMPSSSIFINDSIPSPEISVKHIIDNHTPGELILFKASHKMRLDKIANMIMEEERIRNEL